jgi:hypothetical protein
MSAQSSRFVTLLAVASAACGLRTELDRWYGPTPEGRGGGGQEPIGEAGAPPCAPEVTHAAQIRLPDGAAEVLGVEAVQPRGAPEHVCFASEVTNGKGEPSVALGCFEPWGPWPGSLGMAGLFAGNTGGLSASSGNRAGYSLLAGDVDPGSPPGLRVAWDLPGATPSSLTWTDLGPMGASRAVFLTPTGAGALVGGLASAEGGGEMLRVARISPAAVDVSEAVACAQGQVSADAVAQGDRVVVATVSDRATTGCDGGEIDVPRRLRVLALDEDGQAEPLYEAVHPAGIADVAITGAGEDGVWVAWLAASSIRAAHVDLHGLDAPPVPVAWAEAGPIAIAPLADELLVAHVDRSAEPASVVVRAVGTDGGVRTYGSFDTETSPWVSDLEIVVAPSGLSVLVGYVGTIGSSVRAFARRLDCTE